MSSFGIQQILPPCLGDYGLDYQTYSQHYLLYLSTTLMVKRDLVNFHRVNNVYKRGGAKNAFVGGFMTIGDLFRKYQPKQSEILSSKRIDLHDDVPIRVEQAGLSHLANAPAPVLACAPNAGDGVLKGPLGLRAVNCHAVNENPTDLGVGVRLGYRALTKNEIFRKFSTLGVAPQRFKIMWDKNEKIREGHPIFVNAQFEVARCMSMGIDPKKDICALAAMETWNNLANRHECRTPN